jgi:ABC-type transporter Mla maintaining outer membrane lipid asymmetry ATPase subunit MlaF
VKPRRKSVVTAVIVVTIANAVLDPDLVFADEPTSGLIQSARRKSMRCLSG